MHLAIKLIKGDSWQNLWEGGHKLFMQNIITRRKKRILYYNIVVQPLQS